MGTRRTPLKPLMCTNGEKSNAHKTPPSVGSVLELVLAHERPRSELDAELYRVAGPRHTTPAEIVSEIGAFLAGGRWNPSGEMKVVYLSQEPETALKESLEHFRYHGLPISSALPKVTVAVRAALDKTLDLTDLDTSDTLPISIAELLAEDWRAMMAKNTEPASQAVGWAAFATGIQGLKVPSKPDRNGVNILVFPENLTSECRLEVMNASELDKLGKPLIE
jgi:RES domain-containing protein